MYCEISYLPRRTVIESPLLIANRPDSVRSALARSSLGNIWNKKGCILRSNNFNCRFFEAKKPSGRNIYDRKVPLSRKSAVKNVVPILYYKIDVATSKNYDFKHMKEKRVFTICKISIHFWRCWWLISHSWEMKCKWYTKHAARVAFMHTFNKQWKLVHNFKSGR